jgi:co-chaperonin GroES (HSP10)
VKAIRKGQRFSQSKVGRGVAMTDENLTFIPAGTKLKPLRDQIIIEPMDIMHSRVLIIPPHESKLIRGKVIAAGPGHYPNRYLDKNGDRIPDGRKVGRTQIVAGTVFVPNPVRVGDTVHLDGRQTGKSAFDAFYWGPKYCIHARAEDVAGVEDRA